MDRTFAGFRGFFRIEEKDLVRASLSVFIVALSILLIFQLSPVAKGMDWRVSTNEFVSYQFRYQLLLLGLALLTLSVLVPLARENLTAVLSVGDIDAPAAAVPLFGIKQNESWFGLGIGLSVVVTSMTALFVYYQFRGSGLGWSQVFPLFGWVLLFSLTNSFSEEAIFRLGVLCSLAEVTSARNILLISAVVFGLSHYRGMPNGPVGMLMAGVLGWLLMKSILETQGIFWAWSIHFLQDVVIFSGLLLVNSQSPTH